MNTIETIKSRRSIRKYKSDIPVADEHIYQMLEAAMMAPSACNSRPWEFVVVKDKEVLAKIMKAVPFASMLKTAPMAIVVCGMPEVSRKACRRIEFWQQDCGAAVQNLLLCAKELGYGTCWCGTYPIPGCAEKMQAILGVDSIPMATVAVGVADEEPAARGFYEETKVKFL
ncbi:MAG: nitroreductase family protein [Lachnospiraceae bacterium]|nr:nitroreductase family protein [Lachnospiraceae bacterium]